MLLGCACAWLFLGLPVLLRQGIENTGPVSSREGTSAEGDKLTQKHIDEDTLVQRLSVEETRKAHLASKSPNQDVIASSALRGVRGKDENHGTSGLELPSEVGIHVPREKQPSEKKYPQVTAPNSNSAARKPPPLPPHPTLPRPALPLETPQVGSSNSEKIKSALSEENTFKAGKVVGKTAVVVICYNRPKYLKRTLSYILERYMSGIDIFISQDGSKPSVTQVIQDFTVEAKKKIGVKVVHLNHVQHGGRNGYEKLAIHFGWVLKELFDSRGFARVIIVEDDMEIAPDFFSYFLSTAPLLDADETLMAVSAFNDNGFKGIVSDPKRIVRSDYFPGLGWMLNRRLWKEWGPKWPKGYWDDWLREPAQRRGRAVLRPEICRSFTFGRRGVSTGQFYDKFLGRIFLNNVEVDWSKEDLSYLAKNKFDNAWTGLIDAAKTVSVDVATKWMRGVSGLTAKGDLKVFYKSLERGQEPSFMSIAQRLNIMDSIKAKVPRCAYMGALSMRLPGSPEGQRLFIVQIPNGFQSK